MLPKALSLLPTLPEEGGNKCPCLGQSFLLSNHKLSYKVGSVCTRLFPLLLSFHITAGSLKALGQEHELNCDFGRVIGAKMGTKDPITDPIQGVEAYPVQASLPH
jgi:hypothetical protein